MTGPLARFRAWRGKRRVIRAVQSVQLSVVALNQAMIKAGYGRNERRQVWRELLKTQGAILPWFVGHDAGGEA